MVRVLARHASGVSLKQVGAEEFISYRAVNTIVAELKDRLGVLNLVQAGLRAHQLGYLSLPDDDGIVRTRASFQGTPLDNTTQEEV